MSSAVNWEELVGPTLLNDKDEEVPTSEALRGKKHVMLYFSAHWCPPCRRFTPVLAAAYNAHREYLLSRNGKDDDDDDNGDIEVVFISSDSVQSEYDSYRGCMPWLSVPFSNLHRLRIKDSLSTRYAVRGIPALIVLDGAIADLVTADGRGRYGEYFKGSPSSTSSSCIAS